MAGEIDRDDWTLRWPAGADRVDVRDGQLMFELQGPGKRVWSEEDLAAAQRCYRGQRVTLSDSRTTLLVDPPGVEAGAGAARPGRTVIRVSADQVSAARNLASLRGGLDKVPPLIAKVAQARPAAHTLRTTAANPRERPS